METKPEPRVSSKESTFAPVSTGIKGSRLCAVKGADLQRVKVPSGNWFAPPGSNRSGGGGNEAAEASDAKGRSRRPRESVVLEDGIAKAPMHEVLCQSFLQSRICDENTYGVVTFVHVNLQDADPL